MTPRGARLTDEQIGELADVAWAEITTFFKPDCCVLATRVFMDVLRELGESATFGISVCAVFYNRVTADHARSHGCNLWHCDAERGEGAVQVHVGLPPAQRPPVDPNPELNAAVRGHVAAIVRRRMLVDLTVSQANHPEVGVPIEGTLVLPVGAGFQLGTGEVVAETESGVHLRYFALPGDRWYTEGGPLGDWSADTIVHRDLVGGILARWRGEEPQYSREMTGTLALVGKV